VKQNEKNDWDIDEAQAYIYRNYDELLRTPRWCGKIRWSAARKKKARPAHAGPTYDRVSIPQIEESIWDVLAEKWAGARAGARER
jgi:hypothetical protein